VTCFGGTTFANITHINEGGWAIDAAIGSDGTVFLANGREGMLVYKYSSLVEFDDVYPAIPKCYTLSQIYPNPFNSSTTIKFSLLKSDFVELKVTTCSAKKSPILSQQNCKREIIRTPSTAAIWQVAYITIS